MVKRLLVPVDGSPQADDALAFAVDEWSDADVLLLSVIDPSGTGFSTAALARGGEEWYERATERAETVLDRARERVDRDVSTKIAVGGPAATIVDVAETEDVDHVVVGSHGREGVSRILLGSVAETVVRRSPVPVTVVRGYEP